MSLIAQALGNTKDPCLALSRIARQDPPLLQNDTWMYTDISQGYSMFPVMSPHKDVVPR
jgi:hypothetical protein